MKLGVIVCPQCKQAKVVDLSCKSTRCPRCGKMLRIDQLKIMYKTDSQEKLRQAIGLINANVEGKLEDFKKLYRE